MLRQPSSSSRPRVLFFDDRYYAAQGAQKLLVRLAVFAQDAGFDVTVGSTRGGALLNLALENGLHVVELGMPEHLDRWGGELVGTGGLGRLRTIWALARQNFSLARRIRRGGYDLVWAAAMRPMLSLLVTALIMRVPVVWQIMGSGYFRGFSELASLAATRIVPIAEGLQPAIGIFRARPRVRSRIRIVQTGVPAPTDLTSPRRELQDELQLPDGAADKVWIVAIGAHIAEKGLRDVIIAVERLPDSLRAKTFLLLGGPPIEGDYHDDLLEAARRNPDLISVHGWVDNSDAWLRAADIYVLASCREGMPLTLVEAMQRGAAAIAYPVGGVPELISHNETGLLVPEGSVDELSSAIAALLGDAELRETLASAGRAFVLVNNTDEKMRERFENTIAECLPLPSTSSSPL